MTLPELLAHKRLRGIAIGGCVIDAKPIAAAAHAHYDRDHYLGWVCLDRLQHLNATTVCHELAHILRGNDRHDEAWRRVVRRELGGRVERRYSKRPAKRRSHV